MEDTTLPLLSLNCTVLQRLQRNDPLLKELRGFGCHSIRDVSSALIKNTTVASFRFNRSDLNDSSCVAIIQMLIARQQYQVRNVCVSCRPSAIRISLAWNQIGRVGAFEIAELLRNHPDDSESKDSQIYHCSGKVGRFEGTCIACGKRYLLSNVNYSDQIRLQLLQNFIGDEGVTAITSAISPTNSMLSSHSNYLTELGLEQNEIGDYGMIAIADMLKSNDTLKLLLLDKNHISCKGACYLSDALRVNNTLEVLSLMGNKCIGDTGASFLGNALRFNTTLNTLLLKKCGISAQGAMCIMQALYCDESPDKILNESNHCLTVVTFCQKNLLAYPKGKTVLKKKCKTIFEDQILTQRDLLRWNKSGCITARRLKLDFFLSSYHGHLHLYSLNLDRKMLPSLLYKLWMISGDEYSNVVPSSLNILWSFLRGMPGLVESQLNSSN